MVRRISLLLLGLSLIGYAPTVLAAGETPTPTPYPTVSPTPIAEFDPIYPSDVLPENPEEDYADHQFDLDDYDFVSEAEICELQDSFMKATSNHPWTSGSTMIDDGGVFEAMLAGASRTGVCLANGDLGPPLGSRPPPESPSTVPPPLFDILGTAP